MKDKIFVNSVIPAQLRWACRRGMLELDVLLGNFLEEAYLSSTPQEQANFVKLLDCNDQELFMWLTGKEISPQLELMDMVEKVRHHAKIRKHAASL